MLKPTRGLLNPGPAGYEVVTVTEPSGKKNVKFKDRIPKMDMKTPKILKYDITFDWKEMKWMGLHVDHFNLWRVLYPDVDAFQFLTVEAPRFMMRYVQKREGDKVTVLKKWQNRNWPKTINVWLAKEQIKAVGL